MKIPLHGLFEQVFGLRDLDLKTPQEIKEYERKLDRLAGKERVRPIDTDTFPLYFEYAGDKFKRIRPDVYVMKYGGTGKEFSVYKKTSDDLMDALMGGHIITKEEYDAS